LIAERQYLLGDQFTLADCGVATIAAFVGRIGVDLAPFTNVGAYVARCMSRPALGRAMAG
jgi:glutathione S-transferase